MILLLVFFLIIFFIYTKNKSVAWIMCIIQLLAVGGSFFLGRDIKVESIEDYGWLFLIMLLLFLIISPWRYYFEIKDITAIDKSKLKFLTSFLIVVNSIAFVILLIITIIVQSAVTDVNEFKYTSGVNENFIANNLPFPKVFFSVAIILSNFSYFILPLHFYYLYRKRYWLSIICLILSFNIMLLGLTYFSRAVVVQYMFLYVTLLYLHYGSFASNVKKIIRNTLLILGILSTVYFINISTKRFKEDASAAKKYQKTIPRDAITQDPLIYSFVDYTSQGYINGFEVLQLYRGEGFGGSITFEKIQSIITTPQKTYERLKYRQKLWPYHYSYSFTSFPAYAVYDYSIFGSIILCLIYFYAVRRARPIKNIIQLKNLFLLVFLIQIPLMSIFYNEMSNSIIAFILLIPIWIYLSFKITKS